MGARCAAVAKRKRGPIAASLQNVTWKPLTIPRVTEWEERGSRGNYVSTYVSACDANYNDRREKNGLRIEDWTITSGINRAGVAA